MTGKASRGGKERRSRIGLSRSVSVLSISRKIDKRDVPRGLHDLVSHEKKLRNDAKNIEMYTEREKEVPE